MLLLDTPVIRANGYTLVWKPGTSKETDEYSLFFEDKAVLSTEGNNTNLSLRFKSLGECKLIFHSTSLVPIHYEHRVTRICFFWGGGRRLKGF